MNYTWIAGRLGNDPETRFTPSGQKVTTLRVACRSRRGGQEETIWWKVTIWGDSFDKILPYFKKGSAIIVMGEMSKPEIYTNKEGQPQVSLNIVAHNISFSPFGGKKSEEGQNNNFAAGGQQSPQGGGVPFETSFGSGESPQGAAPMSEEEIPF